MATEEMGPPSELAPVPTVTTETSRRSRPSPPGPGALTTGLAFGLPAAAMFGPLGLLVGGAYGVLAGRAKKRWLDNQAEYYAQVASDQRGFSEEVAYQMERASPEERETLRYYQKEAQRGFQMMDVGDRSGAALVDKAKAAIEGILTADRQAEKEREGEMRGLITDAAKLYRNEFQEFTKMREIDNKASDRLLALMADPSVDPNSPLVKSVAMDLISASVGGLYKDAPDAWDALAQGSGALSNLSPWGAVAGTVGTAVGTYMKSDDFKVTREDWNRLALNAKKMNDNATQVAMQRLQSQAGQLDSTARRLRLIDDDYSFSQYISGGESAPRLSAPRQRAVPSFAPTSVPPTNTPTRQLQWNSTQKSARPTN